MSWSRPQSQAAHDELGPLIPPVFGPNVRANTDTTNFGQHEPSLAVSRTDNDVVFAAAKDYREGNIKRVWIYGSTDGGNSWPVQLHMPGLPPTENESDPVVMARDDGRIYVSCLTTGNNGIFITWTDNDGQTWQPSVPVAQNQSGLQDKDWFAIDNNPSSPYYHRMYMMYAPDAAYVVTHYSTDGGLTWSPRQQIGAPGTEYTYPVVASDGTVYNFMMYNWGASNLGMVQLTKSTDGGVTWSAPSSVSQAYQPTYNIRQGDSFRFFAIISAGVDPTSQGPNHTLYASWTDDRTYSTTGTDVIYVKSTDGGATWSQPINLAQRAGRPECPACDNITPMMTVGQDGKVHAFWLDRANNPVNGGLFDSWYSSSTDGGATWDPATRVSTESQDLNVGFPPGSGNAAGDYWGLDVSGDSVYVAWNDTRLNNQQDILVSRGIMGGPSVTPTVPTPEPTSTATATTPPPSATPTNAPPTSTATAQPPTFTPGATGTPTGTPIAGCEPEWRLVVTPEAAQVQDIAVVSRHAAWAVTTDTIHYWNGTIWEVSVHLTPSPVATPPTLEHYSLKALSVYSATDVWAAGSHGDVGGNVFTYVMHWNGTGWSRVHEGQAPHEDPQGGTLRYLFDIQSLGPGEAIAVGGSFFGGTPIILRCTTGGCSNDTPPHNFGPYNSVSASSPDDIWIVGGSGISLAAHFDGTVWQEVSVPDAGTLRAVVSISPNDAWAAGENGLLHWNGAAWSQFGGSPTQGYSLSATSSNDVWLAADTNGVWHWDGNTWTQSLAMTAHFYSISALNPFEVWAAGVGLVNYTAPRQFSDVLPSSTFYSQIQTLACQGIISGYPCGGPGEPCEADNHPYFRPNAGITRGQLSKVVSLAAGFTEPVPTTQQTFADVPYGATFWEVIERMASRSIVEGYPCGGEGEPCDAENRPYFRPNNPTTRGQISKVVAIAAGYTQTPTTQTFEDVAPGSTFYVWVENLAQRDIMHGYPCGGEGEPCGPGNRPYFRTNNPATRGQVSKIVANTFYP
jgi:photosystem II stability/assembly factor-like uncharacterized protein